MGALRAMAERADATDLLPAIDFPALVVGGAEDSFTPPDELRALAASIPSGRFELLAGSGHVCAYERPRRLQPRGRGVPGGLRSDVTDAALSLHRMRAGDLRRFLCPAPLHMTSSSPTPSAAPRTNASPRRSAARARASGAVLFRHRGWLPVPFLLVPLLARGTPDGDRTGSSGILLIAIGEAIRLAGVAAAGTVTRRRSRTVQRLVTYGIFAWMRNPLYVGNFLIWMGFTVISGVLWFIPVAIGDLFAIEYTLIVRYEEGVLESIFGEEYLAYKQRTPRWFPRPPADERGGRAPLGRGLAQRDARPSCSTW